MSLHLFSARRSCHELGVCQRTTPQCRRVCHIAKAGDEPPVGYEAARESKVHELRAEHNAQMREQLRALKGQPCNRDEAQDSTAGPWVTAQRGLIFALCGGLLLALLGLVYVSAADPGFLLLDIAAARQALAAAWDTVVAIGWAAINLGS